MRQARATLHCGLELDRGHDSNCGDGRDGIAETLVTGSTTGLADFKRCTDKHRPQTVKWIVGGETVDPPSEHQLISLARECFLRHDRMSGTPTPS